MLTNCTKGVPGLLSSHDIPAKFSGQWQNPRLKKPPFLQGFCKLKHKIKDAINRFEVWTRSY